MKSRIEHTEYKRKWNQEVAKQLKSEEKPIKCFCFRCESKGRDPCQANDLGMLPAI